MTFGDKSVQKARDVNLVDFCEYLGCELKDEGNGDHRLEAHGGLIIKENYFKHFSSDAKGNAVDFCMQILGMEFREAVKELLAFERSHKTSNSGRHSTGGPSTPRAAGLRKKDIEDRNNNDFKLPQRDVDNKRVYAYLTKTRGLPGQIVNELIERNLIYQDIMGNCVFPCYDLSGKPMGAFLRGTLTDKPFKGKVEGSNGDFGWVVEPTTESDTVIIMESPIDSLSMVALYPKQEIMKKYYLLALGGLQSRAIWQFLRTHQLIKSLVLGLDNDAAAEEAIIFITQTFGDSYKIVVSRPKEGKDWNEQLLKKPNR